MPVWWDPNGTGNNRRRSIDDRWGNGNDRWNNTENDPRPPAAAAPAVVPPGMPCPAPMVPPRRRRRRHQRSHGKCSNGRHTNGDPDTRSDLVHVSGSYRFCQRCRSAQRFGPPWRAREAQPANVAVEEIPAGTTDIRRDADPISAFSMIAVWSCPRCCRAGSDPAGRCEGEIQIWGDAAPTSICDGWDVSGGNDTDDSSTSRTVGTAPHRRRSRSATKLCRAAMPS